ncbi:MAG: insulinase family protein [Deltaproteobacteria bacterium]|nr:insulinase family protein [Deltaproteobacteria bacterium]
MKIAETHDQAHGLRRSASIWRFALHAMPLLLVACGGPPTPVAVPPPSATPAAQTHGDEPAALEREALRAPSLVSMPSNSPLITLRVVFDAGSADDPEGQEGITHLAAAIMASGGAGELSYSERMQRLYPMAASLEAHVDRDQTVFVGRVHADYLDEFYALFRDALLTPRFAQADFDRILSQTQSALTLELRGNNDEALGKEMLQAMIYPDHPYGRPAIGTETGLASLTLEGVRAFRRRVFCAGRASVGVAGRVPEGFAARVLDDVRSLSFDECQGRLALPEPSTATAESSVLLVDKPEARAVAVSMGLPIDVTRADEDYPALMLAASYLGQHRQFAGVLMQKIRGLRGMNYGDYAYAEHFEQAGWSRFPRTNISRRQQYFSIWLRPLRREQARFAIRLAVRELRRFVEEGLSEEDFTRIQNFAERYYALYQQTESRRLGFALDDVFYGQQQAWLEGLRQSWSSLTRDELNAAIRRHVHPEHLQIAVVVPDAEAFASELAAQTPSPIEYRASVSAEVLAEDREIVSYPIGIPRSRMRIVPVAQTFR